jgi:hypothetical protein
MGKGPGPSALEQLFVANTFETPATFKSTLTRFNIKTHEATTPIERTYLSSNTYFVAKVAVYKGKVYVANNGDGESLGGSSVDVFNANTLELEKTWKTSQFGPAGVAAYKDNIYVTCASKTGGHGGGNAVDVFHVDTETGDEPTKSWKTSQFGPVGVAAYKDNIYVTCYGATEDGDKDGNAVDVFPVDTDNTGATPAKSWVTTQFGPVGIAAYKDNIYVTCLWNDGEDNPDGNAVDVFPVDTDNTGGPDKSWQTSQFGPFGVAAYKDNIYVTCISKNGVNPGNAVDVFHVDTGNTKDPDKSWITSQFGPTGVAAYEENIYVTCYGVVDGEVEDIANTINIFPVAAETEAEPSEIWKTDYGPGRGIAAYNSLHPEGNLYIDFSGSNVV